MIFLPEDWKTLIIRMHFLTHLTWDGSGQICRKFLLDRTLSIIAFASSHPSEAQMAGWSNHNPSNWGKILLPLRGSKVDVDDRSIAVMGMSDGASLALSMVP